LMAEIKASSTAKRPPPPASPSNAFSTVLVDPERMDLDKGKMCLKNRCALSRNRQGQKERFSHACTLPVRSSVASMWKRCEL
jgi:hypothetical protein